MGELPHQTDEFFDILSPLLKEDAAFANDELPPRDRQDVLSLLLEENARLRALAVTLSNLLGDLPVREWAMTACPRTPPVLALEDSCRATERTASVSANRL